MGKIDVSFLITDPDFCDSFTIVRRKQVINEFGENSFEETIIPTIGSVQWQTADYEKRPDMTHYSRVISVFSKTKMFSDNDEMYNDQIIWKGRKFIVKTIEVDAMNWGRGFNKCYAVLEEGCTP